MSNAYYWTSIALGIAQGVEAIDNKTLQADGSRTYNNNKFSGAIKTIGGGFAGLDANELFLASKRKKQEKNAERIKLLGEEGKLRDNLPRETIYSNEILLSNIDNVKYLQDDETEKFFNNENAKYAAISLRMKQLQNNSYSPETNQSITEALVSQGVDVSKTDKGYTFQYNGIEVGSDIDTFYKNKVSESVIEFIKTKESDDVNANHFKDLKNHPLNNYTSEKDLMILQQQVLSADKKKVSIINISQKVYRAYKANPDNNMLVGVIGRLGISDKNIIYKSSTPVIDNETKTTPGDPYIMYEDAVSVVAKAVGSREVATKMIERNDLMRDDNGDVKVLDLFKNVKKLRKLLLQKRLDAYGEGVKVNIVSNFLRNPKPTASVFRKFLSFMENTQKDTPRNNFIKRYLVEHIETKGSDILEGSLSGVNIDRDWDYARKYIGESMGVELSYTSKYSPSNSSKIIRSTNKKF